MFVGIPDFQESPRISTLFRENGRQMVVNITDACRQPNLHRL
jgi:hypothetical protein